MNSRLFWRPSGESWFRSRLQRRFLALVDDEVPDAAETLFRDVAPVYQRYRDFGAEEVL